MVDGFNYHGNEMTAGGWISAPVLAVVIALGACRPALGGETKDYPIWWSPELGLDSLDRIEEALRAPFPWRRQFHVYKHHSQLHYLNELRDEHRPEKGYGVVFQEMNLRDRLVVDCVSLMKSVRDGYSWEGHEGYKVSSYWSGYCYALDALTAVNPARTSNLRDFVFDEDAKKYLPAMVGEGWDCRLIDPLLEANRNSVPWADFEFDWAYEDTTTYELIIESTNKIVEVRRVPELDNEVFSRRWVTIYGRGDFNGDSLDDLLLLSQDESASTGARDSALYVVTRFRPDAVLQVVGALGTLPYETHKHCPLQPGDFPIGAD